MDDATQDRLDRKHRPQLFHDCTACGEPSVRKEHVCDTVRSLTFNNARSVPYEPNEETLKSLEEELLAVFMKHRMVVTSAQLRDLALAVEPSTRGPQA